MIKILQRVYSFLHFPINSAAFSSNNFLLIPVKAVIFFSVLPFHPFHYHNFWYGCLDWTKKAVLQKLQKIYIISNSSSVSTWSLGLQSKLHKMLSVWKVDLILWVVSIYFIVLRKVYLYSFLSLLIGYLLLFVAETETSCDKLTSC